MLLPVAPPPVVPSLVLDTNVVLDWLVFADPRSDAAAAAVLSGRVRWIASAPMRVELERVLLRGVGARSGRSAATIVAAFDRWAVIVETAVRRVVPALRCTDEDDQMFIDLALQARATALLSRDRAVLRLARPARVVGLDICHPERWQAP